MSLPSHLLNRRVLTVDDNPTIHEDFRKILCKTLAASDPLEDMEAALFETPAPKDPNEGFAVDAACQGEEGLAKVQQALAEGQPYALAFVDMRMPPGWDGVETITRLWEADPALQIVICTAYSDYAWEDVLSRLGNRNSLAVLKKPFDNIEVVQLCETLTQKWSLNRWLSTTDLAEPAQPEPAA